MRHLTPLVLLMTAGHLNAVAPPTPWYTSAVESALHRSGANRGELQLALSRVPADQRTSMAFLLEHMPAGDLRTLRADFLCENVALAHLARRESPWGKTIPDERFLNDVLPYANLDEPRHPWRKQLREIALPLVKDCTTAAEAARKINAKLFGVVKVRYSTARKRANQSPAESMETGLASCTGLSVLLVDACRSVGIPARVVGTPLWADRSGNHTWVEIWDGRWQFTGAAEQDPAGMDPRVVYAPRLAGEEGRARERHLRGKLSADGDALPDGVEPLGSRRVRGKRHGALRRENTRRRGDRPPGRARSRRRHGQTGGAAGDGVSGRPGRLLRPARVARRAARSQRHRHRRGDTGEELHRPRRRPRRGGKDGRGRHQGNHRRSHGTRQGRRERDDPQVRVRFLRGTAGETGDVGVPRIARRRTAQRRGRRARGRRRRVSRVAGPRRDEEGRRREGRVLQDARRPVHAQDGGQEAGRGLAAVHRHARRRQRAAGAQRQPVAADAGLLSRPERRRRLRLRGAASAEQHVERLLRHLCAAADHQPHPPDVRDAGHRHLARPPDGLFARRIRGVLHRPAHPGSFRDGPRQRRGPVGQQRHREEFA